MPSETRNELNRRHPLFVLADKIDWNLYGKQEDRFLYLFFEFNQA